MNQEKPSLKGSFLDEARAADPQVVYDLLILGRGRENPFKIIDLDCNKQQMASSFQLCVLLKHRMGAGV